MKMTYFIAGGGFVKIGSSANPEKRRAALATTCPFPLVILRTHEIGEKEAHEIASRYARRVSGEWFEQTPRLMEWINSGKEPELRVFEIEASAPVIRMIIAKCEEWQCPPSDAVRRLINELAKRRAKHAA